MGAPNVGITGVIQNPGIGQILGGGLSQLAQFLQQKQQMEQQQAIQQQQLGQGQQQIDLSRQAQINQQPLLQQQAQEARLRSALMQSQLDDAATAKARGVLAATNMQHYLFGDPNKPDEPPPGSKDLAPAQLESYRRQYQIDPQGTTQHLTELMTKPDVAVADKTRLVNPLTGKVTLEAVPEPLKVSEEWNNAQQQLSYGNIPLPKLNSFQNAQIGEQMVKNRERAAAKTFINLGADKMAEGIAGMNVAALTARNKEANAAAADMATAGQALHLLEKSGGDVYQGILSDAAPQVAAFLKNLGFADDPKAIRTAQVAAKLAQRIIPTLKEAMNTGGSGAGRILSTEVDIQKIANGDLKNMPAAALVNLLKDAQTLNAYKLAKYKTFLKTVNPDQYVKGTSTILDVNPSDYIQPDETPIGTGVGGSGAPARAGGPPDPNAKLKPGEVPAVKNQWGVGGP